MSPSLVEGTDDIFTLFFTKEKCSNKWYLSCLGNQVKKWQWFVHFTVFKKSPNPSISASGAFQSRMGRPGEVIADAMKIAANVRRVLGPEVYFKLIHL